MDWSIRRVNVHDSSCGVGKLQLRWKQIRLTQVRHGFGLRNMLVQCCKPVAGFGSRVEPRLYIKGGKESLGIESDRPADYCGVPGGDHAVWAAVSQAAADDARLLSRRPQHSVVGDFAVDCGGGDQHADHYQYSRPRLQFESYFSAMGDGGRDRARHYQFCAAPTVFSWRVVYGVSAD